MGRTCTKCFLQKPIEDFPWKYSRLVGMRSVKVVEVGEIALETGIFHIPLAHNSFLVIISPHTDMMI